MALLIRPLEEGDLDAADHVMRVAFGTFLGIPNPATAFDDADYVRSRFTAEPGWCFAAELDGELVGSNFATRWGSFAFFGPLSVRADLWNRGIAGKLVAATVDLFDRWGVRQSALFTFPQSPKHLALYQKFGFWPQYLTALVAKALAPTDGGGAYRTFGALAEDERDAMLASCRALTGEIFAGLDVGHEIRATQAQRLGDTVLVASGATLMALGVCHLGAGESGSGRCYVKFGAVRPGPDAGVWFERLLEACEDLANTRGLERVVTGVNVARHDAYRRIQARGYRAWMQGVILQRPDEPGYCRPDVYALDDLR